MGDKRGILAISYLVWRYRLPFVAIMNSAERDPHRSSDTNEQENVL
jgi:hypothetical protein